MSNKLDARKFGLAGGILWGAVMLVSTILAVSTGYATEFLNLFASIYPGFNISGGGVVVGLIYGFVDGFVGCWLFAKIYNGLLG